MQPRWIADDTALAEVVAVLGDQAEYALDTEFMAERTYWPRLCLIQVAWRGGVALIDPLAVDVTALEPVLRSDALLVTHAGGSDLPIVERAVGARPARLFDVQVAAGFVGLGQPSLAFLVQHFLSRRLDKGDRLTDWSKRPLADTALSYAADDVAHLLDLADAIGERLDALGRRAWAVDECDELRTLSRGDDPDTAWWRIKGARSLKDEYAGIAQSVAAWRELRARRIDIPARFVLSDLALTAVVSKPPRTADQVLALRGANGLKGDAVAELLAAIEAGRALPADAVRRPPRNDERADRESAVAILAAWAGNVAAAEHLDPKLLATRDDVTNLVYGRPSRLDHGWRGELAGAPLRRLLSGETALRIADGGRRLEAID